MKSKLACLPAVVTRELQAARQRRIGKQTEAIASYLASLVESCDDAIIGKTLDGTIISWNKGAERLYGFRPAEIIGQSISRILPHFRPPELLDKIRAGKHGARYETVSRRKDGTFVDVSFTISPINDAGGRMIGASTIVRDGTQHKIEERERLTLIKELTTALAQSQESGILQSSSPAHWGLNE
jgi:PAS domain S-box-containing protein